MALALLAALLGGALTVRAWRLQPRRDAEAGGLRLRMERAVWLHEPTDHGDSVQLPVSAGAPRVGERRLSVALVAFNPGRAARAFSSRELLLRAGAAGPTWRPSGVDAASPVVLAPGQWLPLSLDFDVPSNAGGLLLEWERGPERVMLLATRTPPSVAPAALPRWPRSVEDLPRGNPTDGAALFHGRFACVTCHGEPSAVGGNPIGPSLHAFARVAATRMVGKSAAQYAYESLLDPDAFIASGCVGQGACVHPSTMPMYGDSLSQQQMADLLGYLLEGQGGP